MRQSMQAVADLIKSKAKCIWINTFEEEAVIKDIKEISLSLKIPMDVYSHSYTLGLQKQPFGKKELDPPDRAMNIDQLMLNMYNITRGIKPSEDLLEMWKESGRLIIDSTNNIFIIKDMHLLLNSSNPQYRRYLRDIVEEKYKDYNTIIVLAPYYEVPLELEKIFSVVDYETPNEALINTIVTSAASKAGIKMATFEKEEIVKLCKGLTMNEIVDIMRLSIVKHKTISSDEIANYKIELIKKSSILEYKIPSVTFDEVGGNEAFKSWVDEVVDSMSSEAKEFGIPQAKGYLALGIPGTSKTMLAEALASKLTVPYLKLDMSKILDSKVGSSEQNISQAIRMIKSSAPCVLLVDEIEKTLSGMGSSNNSDAGTMARVIGSILEFLNEDHGVFVVMTSNDVTQLPPELTRTGRVDAIWYFGLPTTEERKEIFNIHFTKLNRTVSDSISTYAASITERYTGAEIKEAVKSSIRKSYTRYKKDGNKNVTQADIKSACEEIIPIAVSSREKIAALDAYAKNRARSTSEVKKESDKPVSRTTTVIKTPRKKKEETEKNE